MNAKDIIEKIARDKTLETIAKNYHIPEADIPDLVQFILLQLLEYDQGKIEKMYGDEQLQFFLTRMVSNNYYSRTSRYFYEIKRYDALRDRNNTPELFDNDEDN